MSSRSLCALFDEDAARLDRLGHDCPGLYADFSKQKVDARSLDALVAFAHSRDLPGFFKAMADGKPVNASEGRPALHMALRDSDGSAGRDAMTGFADKLRSGALKGVTGRAIHTLVHIGIGGSDLGPRLLAAALKRFRQPGISVRFAANLDAADINDALSGCDPEATMVVVVSKSFKTLETLANARVARAWLVQHLGETAPARQMMAISSNLEATRAFGIDDAHVLAMPEGAGGRYSLWSAVGVSVMAALHEGAFDDLLAGAAAMDAHVLNTPLAQNAPLVSGLIQFWNRNFLGLRARAIVPYGARLALLPHYLQQLIMESNGKAVQSDGRPARFAASKVIFGAEGTNAQHAFFQQLHQGPDPVPVDFIGFIADQEHNPAQHSGLLANMLAQARALMTGRPLAPIEAQMRADGMDESAIAVLAPQQAMPGDRPSTTLLMDALSPYCLGALIAFFEHETVTQAVLCGINPFDQWGVELGKSVALEVQERLQTHSTTGMDASTAALIDKITKVS